MSSIDNHNTIEVCLDRLEKKINDCGSFDATPDDLLDAYVMTLHKRDVMEFQSFLSGEWYGD